MIQTKTVPILPVNFVGIVNMQNKVKRSGFTIIELLVTLALFSIIATTVTPSLGNFYKRNRVAAIVNNHISAIQLARHTAVSENVFVVVCPSNDMQNCTDDWALNKIVFVDEDGDGALDGNEEIIASIEMVTDYRVISTRDTLRFAPFNTAQNNTATISICPDEETTIFSRAIVISNVGRVRLEKDQADIDCSE